MGNNNQLVLVTDDGKDLSKQCVESLTRYGFSANLVPNDGKILKELIFTKKPKVVVTDVFLRNADAIEVMESVLEDPELSVKPIFLVVSSYDGAEIQRDVMQAGATYFFLKPFDVDMLSRRIDRYMTLKPVGNPIKNQEFEQEQNKAEPDLEVLVTDIIRQIGIPPHIKGYQYLRSAIIICVENPELLESVTKELYPTVAEIYGTTSSRVERAIRHAIEVAWDRGNLDNLSSCLGYNIQSRGKPTNSELIALISDRLRLQTKNNFSVMA